ncbi:MAG TPA: GntR family transcriptional regulator [Solirubrobacteraceae bacterium]|jgi:DNA-binding transcriptional regulator YhcF (GntR family)|nr:GntR family transcriptional regulator [Solirubrobacteraceae bacterium]
MSRAFDNSRSSDEIAIDRKADVPVGVQLDWALCAQIRDGRFAPGERLPTLRELAEETGLNVNTVRTVYRRLEQRGLIESQQGSGTFVAAAPNDGAALSSIAAHAAEEARETGLDPRDVAAALYVAPDTAPALGEAGEMSAERSEQGRRKTLRRQIAAFERTLADLEAEHPGVAPGPDRRARRGIGPALLTADELTHVRAALIRRLTVVQAAIDEHVEVQRREHAEATAPARKPSKAKEPTPDASKRTARPRPTARPAPAS